MFPDRLYIQHSQLEEMLDELAEQVAVRAEVVLRVEVVDRQDRLGNTEDGSQVIDHTLATEVTTADIRGDVHVVHIREADVRVVHADGHQSRGEYKAAFADARETRSRLVGWLEDEGWTVRGGRVWIPPQVSGFPGHWANDPRHAVEEVINGNGGG